MIIFKLGKHIRTAVLGIFRNFWMSFSAMTAVAVTLLLVALFSVLYVNSTSFMDNIEKNITIRAMVDNAYDESKIYNPETKKDPLGDKIRQLDDVERVDFRNKDEEFEKYIKSTGDSAAMYQRFKEKNPMSHIYRVTLKKDKNDYEVVKKQLEQIEGIKSVSYGTNGITKLVEVFAQVSNIMIFFMIALILLTVFLISNTIKLTIYARKTEIQIMRLVGAANGYIRFPFILEGIIIGIMGAIIPAALIVTLYSKLIGDNGGFLVSSSLKFATISQINTIALALFALGAMVGMIGSLVSVGRYLKV